ALHPVQVESVAWISEQKNTLSAVLYLGSALAWMRFQERRDRRSYLVSLGSFALALASKTVAATLPVALLLVHWWRRGRPSWRRDVVPLLPFFLLGGAAGLLTIWVERTLVGAEGAAFQRTPVERVLVAGRAAWFYLGKLVWPADLAFVYPRWQVSPGDWWQYLYPASALAAVSALWALRRRLPGPLTGALFFLVTLLPALGFLDVYPFLFSFVADHFQYLAGLGIVSLAAAGAARLLVRSPPWGRRAVQASCLALLAVLSFLTWRQSRLYADRETLYRAVIRANPGCWMAYSNLAGALVERGAVEEAIPLAQRALALRPGYPEAHDNLGLALFASGRAEEAMAHYRMALELDPGSVEAHNNLGFALAASGRLDEAIDHYRRALEGDPARAGVHYNLAMALLQRGQPGQALDPLRRAVALQPEFLEARNNLGILLARSGQLDEAIEQFRRALRIRPGSAEVQRNLDLALARRGAGSP
ncbi:MAG TPA: tetratricopeptide repeat protein, partial [Anaeromyxobacteraceae bacterium]|nr:tetratricopeptide repeat protein [Anaeromyxobacteraceae bacterium]